MSFIEVIDNGCSATSQKFQEYLKNVNDVISGYTILSYAVYKGREDLVEEILSKVESDLVPGFDDDPPHSPPDHKTVIDLALSIGNTYILHLLFTPKYFDVLGIGMTTRYYRKVIFRYSHYSRLVDYVCYLVHISAEGRVSDDTLQEANEHLADRFCELVTDDAVPYV